MSDPNFGGISLTSRILACMPATIPEIAERCEATHKSVAAIIYNLSSQLRVEKVGKRETSQRGPKPAVWDRT